MGVIRNYNTAFHPYFHTFQVLSRVSLVDIGVLALFAALLPTLGLHIPGPLLLVSEVCYLSPHPAVLFHRGTAPPDSRVPNRPLIQSPGSSVLRFGSVSRSSKTHCWRSNAATIGPPDSETPTERLRTQLLWPRLVGFELGSNKFILMNSSCWRSTLPWLFEAQLAPLHSEASRLQALRSPLLEICAAPPVITPWRYQVVRSWALQLIAHGDSDSELCGPTSDPKPWLHTWTPTLSKESLCWLILNSESLCYFPMT